MGNVGEVLAYLKLARNALKRVNKINSVRGGILFTYVVGWGRLTVAVIKMQMDGGSHCEPCTLIITFINYRAALLHTECIMHGPVKKLFRGRGMAGHQELKRFSGQNIPTV